MKTMIELLVERLEDDLKSMRQRNDDGFFNFEIYAAEAVINKAKGLPYDTYYTGGC